MKFNKDEIKKYLPHRDPFLYVHRVSMEDTSSVIKSNNDLIDLEIIGEVELTEDHFCFVGHFPGNPVLPGVIQVEMLGQSGLFSFAYLFNKPLEQNLEFRLIKVEEFKFKKEGKPGKFKMKSRVIQSRNGFVKFKGELYQNNELISEGVVLGLAINNGEVLK